MRRDAAPHLLLVPPPLLLPAPSAPLSGDWRGTLRDHPRTGEDLEVRPHYGAGFPPGSLLPPCSHLVHRTLSPLALLLLLLIPPPLLLALLLQVQQQLALAKSLVRIVAAARDPSGGVGQSRHAAVPLWWATGKQNPNFFACC